MVHDCDYLTVVGGGDKGGIIVRAEKGLSSQPEPSRLDTGAIVKVMQVDGPRLRYELLSGGGPRSGWVSLQANGYPLLEPCSRDVVESHTVKVPAQTGHQPQGAPGCVVASPLKPVPRRQMPTGGRYFAGGQRPKVRSGQLCQQPKPLFKQTLATPAASPLTRSQLVQDPPMHPECKAQSVVEAMREEDEKRRLQEHAQKRLRRREFGIGWHAGLIPSNHAPARKLGYELQQHSGLCCLVYEKRGLNTSVHVAETAEPAAAVNLEYLSVALKVRRKKEREPFFSLDPKSLDTDSEEEESSKSKLVEEGEDEMEQRKQRQKERREARRLQKPCKDDARMQVKRFEPRWLASTSAGDIMFQSDYYLKELSMGEHDQPIIGMRSGFDYTEEESYEREWTGREWFMVRDAQVMLSVDNVIVPQVVIGVEAREQVMGADGTLEDAKITRPDHPLVRYAEAFSKNFDLIAERKSAIYHLRELAKACVAAKFLHEQRIDLPSQWLELAAEKAEGPWEIPQLWNERCYSKVVVNDGEVVGEDDGSVGMVRRGVYGGVDMRIQQLQAPPPSVGAPGVVAPAAGVPASLAPQRTMIPRPVQPGRRLLSSAPIRRIPLVTPGEPVPSLVAPRGVDLSLDSFNLGEAATMDEYMGGAWLGSDSKSFWTALDTGLAPDGSAVDSKELVLLRDVFHPHLSDRRTEGEKFVPPDVSASYVNRISQLVKAEKEVQQQRVSEFLSKEFDTETPGQLFPHSWRPAFKVEGAPPPGGARCLVKSDHQVVLQALKSPVFDRSTEDGTRFRIYRPGTLEVRTTEPLHGSEEVGVVYSIKPAEA